MVRTVKVRLELDRDDYKRGLRDAANDTRGFDGEVRAAGKDTAAMGVEVKSAGTEVQAMGRQVEAAARKTTALGDEAVKAKQKTTGLGDESDKTKAKIVDLAKEITSTKTALAALGEEFRKTGSVNVDELNKLTRTLRELERAKATVGKLIPGGGDNNNGGLGIGTLLADLGRIVPVAVAAGGGLASIAKSVASGFGTGIKDIGSAALGGVVSAAKAAGGAITSALESGVQSAGKFISSNPMIAGAIAAGITIGVPIIGAALTAAVGAGGIAAGVLLAAKDPRVGAAWSEFAASAKDSLTTAASPFVGVLTHGAETFGNTLDRILPSIQQDFAGLAPVADRLFGGAAGFVEKLMPGIDALSTQAGPILTMLADELPRMGAAVSTMMEAIASGGEGGKQALRDLLVLTEGLIVSVGDGIAVMEKWYQAERSVVQVLSGHFGDARKNWENLIYGIDDASRLAVAPAVTQTWNTVAAAIGSVIPAAQLTGDQLMELQKEIGQTALTADTLAGQMTDKLMGSMLGMSHATLGVAESLTSLHDTFDQNGLAIDRHTGLVSMNTQAGQRNRESVLSAVEANLRQYDAQIASGMSAEDAAKKYDTNTKALHDQLRQAGLTEAQVHDLIGEYGNVPDRVNTTIATQGLTTAIDNLGELIRQINGIPTHKDVYVTQHLGSVGSFYQSPDRLYDYPNRWGGLYQHAAVGALRDATVYSAVSSGARYAFAEPQTGGEAFVPKYGDYGRSMSILGKAASWYGARVMPASQVSAGGGGVSAEAIADALAARLGPMVAAVADRPTVLRVNAVEIARANRKGEQSLGYQQ